MHFSNSTLSVLVLLTLILSILVTLILVPAALRARRGRRRSGLPTGRKVAALLDKYPNADVELSATVQDLGRAPRMIREFFLKYQDRILFGSDGNPGRGVDEFWIPHWRFLETYDEHFDHPAQLRSATGAPLHGRWRIYGIGLPDDVLRKVYYANALRYLPAARASIERQLAAARR